MFLGQFTTNKSKINKKTNSKTKTKQASKPADESHKKAIFENQTTVTYTNTGGKVTVEWIYVFLF